MYVFSYTCAEDDPKSVPFSRTPHFGLSSASIRAFQWHLPIVAVPLHVSLASPIDLAMRKDSLNKLSWS